MIAVKGGSARLALSKTPYTVESLRMGALVVGARAEVFLDEKKDRFDVEIRPARKMKADGLSALAGEFLDECLSCLYRQELIKSSPELAQAVLAQVLEKGFPAMPPDPLEQLEPQVRLDRDNDIEALLAQAAKL